MPLRIYEYPKQAHILKHGPYYDSGNYASYLPWLRDEYLFRCVYCLQREMFDPRQTFNIDHFLPKETYPEFISTYGNLIYSCRQCNELKRSHKIPDPRKYFLASKVKVRENGQIESRDENAQEIIEVLGLDGKDYRSYREGIIRILKLAKKADPELYSRYFSYPDDLPNLKSLRPNGNSQPGGIMISCYQLREDGKLPATY